MNQCSCLLAVRACSWWCDGFGGEVKSWIWSSWLWCSLFLWICPLARGGADTCSLCLGSSTQKVKKNIWCLEQTGEANLVCCLHIIISVRQLAPTHQERKKKRKLPAHSTASFVCVTLTCVTCIRDCAVSKELKIHLRAVWEEIRHIIVRMCLIMRSSAETCTR